MRGAERGSVGPPSLSSSSEHLHLFDSDSRFHQHSAFCFSHIMSPSERPMHCNAASSTRRRMSGP